MDWGLWCCFPASLSQKKERERGRDPSWAFLICLQEFPFFFLLFDAFVGRFRKIAVILGFNVCVLRRFSGLEGAIRTVLLPVFNFVKCLIGSTECSCVRVTVKFNICRPKLYLGFQSYSTGCMDVGHDVTLQCMHRACHSTLCWLVAHTVVEARHAQLTLNDLCSLDVGMRCVNVNKIMVVNTARHIWVLHIPFCIPTRL